MAHSDTLFANTDEWTCAFDETWQAVADGEVLLQASPMSRRRRGRTIWHGSGGRRRVCLTRRSDGTFRALEIHRRGKQRQVHELYAGPDVIDACLAASLADIQIRADGYRSHTEHTVGVQCWVGIGCIWDRPTTFTPDRWLPAPVAVTPAPIPALTLQARPDVAEALFGG